MADDPIDLTQQESVTMPNGVVLTGAGVQDIDAAADQFEARHHERTGQEVEAQTTALAQVESPETPKQPRGQKRFDKLTAEREAEKRRADAAEARIREIETRLNAPQPPAAQPAAVAQPAAEVVATRPKPDEAEIGTKYASLSAYFEDLADWKAEQREAALLKTFDARLSSSIEADRASRTRADYFAGTVFPKGRAVYPDFDAVLKSAEAILIPPAIADAIAKMPDIEHVMYALGKNHDQLKDLIAEKDPVMLGVKLASLTPHAAVVAPLASTPVAVRTSNAPPPPQPVGAGTRTAQPSLAELASSDNYEAYKARRAADRGVTH